MNMYLLGSLVTHLTLTMWRIYYNPVSCTTNGLGTDAQRRLAVWHAYTVYKITDIFQSQTY